jgi:hypothetical protein
LPTFGVAFQNSHAGTNAGMAGREARSTVYRQLLRAVQRNEDLVAQAFLPVSLGVRASALAAPVV